MARAFMLILLTLAVIGFVTVITMSKLNDSADTTLPTLSGYVSNDSSSSVVSNSGLNFNTPGLGTAVSGLRKGVCTFADCINQSTETFIPTTNYSTSGCIITVTDTSGGFNNAIWNCTYTYTYISGDANAVLSNVSSGVAGFFGDATTWLTLLSVIVIILIIGVVVFAVNRFGGGGSMESDSMEGL